MSYFWGKTPGLNADIRRHKEEETRLRQKIDELQSKVDDGDATEMDKSFLRTYRNLLCQLLQSKADVVNKLGR